MTVLLTVIAVLAISAGFSLICGAGMAGVNGTADEAGKFPADKVILAGGIIAVLGLYGLSVIWK